jgi:CO/xanthine dehydrogenase Mo-binding subunit
MPNYVAMFVPTPSALAKGVRPDCWEIEIEGTERLEHRVQAAQTAMDDICDRLDIDQRIIRELELTDEGAFFDVVKNDLVSTKVGRTTVVLDVEATATSSTQEIDWKEPIGVSIPGYGVVGARSIAGPDEAGDYRVSYQCSRDTDIHGMVWFRSTGQAVGKSTARVVNV